DPVARLPHEPVSAHQVRRVLEHDERVVLDEAIAPRERPEQQAGRRERDPGVAERPVEPAGERHGRALAPSHPDDTAESATGCRILAPRIAGASKRAGPRSPPRPRPGVSRCYFASSYRYWTNDITAPSKPCTFLFADSIT